MIEKRENFHALGTALRLKGSDQIYILTGLLPKLPDGRVADYLAVQYPCGYEGTMDSQYLIRTQDIGEVLSEGYRDEACEKIADQIAAIEEKAGQAGKAARKGGQDILG